jgi:hypothetical protein
MSKKLTKKMIEELIKEELAKAEQERLDEFKVDLDDTEAKSIGTIRSKLGLTGNPTGMSYNSHKKAVQKLKKRDTKAPTEPNVLDNDDITALKAMGSGAPKDEVDWVDWAIGNSSKAKLQTDWGAIMTGGGGAWGSTDAGKAGFPDPDKSGVPKTSAKTYNKTQLAKWLNNKVLKKSGLTQAIAQDYVAWIVRHYGSAAGAGKGVGKRLTALQAITGGGGGGTADTKETLKRIIQALNKDISIADRDFETFLGQMASFQVDPGTSSTNPGSVKTTKSVKADSSVIAQFTVFKSDDLEGILEELKVVADFMKGPSTGLPTGVTNEFELITKVNILVNLAILGKAYDESSAGFALEKFCALLFGGAQVGGDNGAADVYAPLANGEVMGLSQKFYNEPQTIEQAKKGLDAYFAASQDALYYFVASKGTSTSSKGAKSAYTHIYLYIITLEQDTGAANEYKASVMKDVSGSVLQAQASYDCGISSGGKIKIGDPDAVNKDFRQIYSERVNQSNQDALKNVLKVYKRLKQIESTSTDFRRCCQSIHRLY